ncbi:MAG: hypothetical protein AAB336_04725 [Acidobacteriota bacterium]
MDNETIDNSIETVDVKGEIRKERGLNWAYISFGLISLAIILGVFFAILIMPKLKQTMDTPANTSGAPVQTQ